MRGLSEAFSRLTMDGHFRKMWLLYKGEYNAEGFCKIIHFSVR